jgi:hypothetical protein
VKPKIIERGWGGHFICADRCLFRRNTLLDFGGKNKVVVSTVGMMRDIHSLKGYAYDTIGAGGRYYETMAFMAKKDGPYWDADVRQPVSFKSEWAICATSWQKLPKDADNRANAMHEQVVKELSLRRVRGGSAT